MTAGEPSGQKAGGAAIGGVQVDVEREEEAEAGPQFGDGTHPAKEVSASPALSL